MCWVAESRVSGGIREPSRLTNVYWIICWNISIARTHVLNAKVVKHLSNMTKMQRCLVFRTRENFAFIFTVTVRSTFSRFFLILSIIRKIRTNNCYWNLTLSVDVRWISRGGNFREPPPLPRPLRDTVYGIVEKVHTNLEVLLPYMWLPSSSWRESNLPGVLRGSKGGRAGAFFLEYSQSLLFILYTRWLYFSVDPGVLSD